LEKIGCFLRTSGSKQNLHVKGRTAGWGLRWRLPLFAVG